MTATQTTYAFNAHDTYWNTVEQFTSPHALAAWLAERDIAVDNIDIEVNGERFAAYDWLDVYNDFKPWLRDEPLPDTDATATGSDGDSGDAGVMVRTVTIPASENHEGIYAMTVTLNWVCPKCGGPRGEPHDAISYDGSRRLHCDGWTNPCGHVDYYNDVREEAKRPTESTADARYRIATALADDPDGANIYDDIFPAGPCVTASEY